LFILISVFALLSVGAFFLFKDTMNKLQYVEYLRLYWITRDIGVKGTPIICKATMRGTGAPYWRGRGIQFRCGKLTFQVGVLKVRVDSLESQISAVGWLDTPTKQLRKWS
jgi:hypothetical protein